MLKGKIQEAEKGQRRTPHQQVMSKLDRRNQARQIQRNKHQDHVKALNIFHKRGGAPKIVTVVPLCENANAQSAVISLSSSLDLQETIPEFGLVVMDADRFKQRLGYILTQRHLIPVLDACRLADVVILVLSAEEEVDSYGETILKCIESQGVSNIITVVQDLEIIQPVKRRGQVLSSLKSYMGHFLPDQDKIYSLDSRQDCTNVVRTVCTSTPRGIRWREDRSWMVVESIRWPVYEATAGGQEHAPEDLTELVVTGVVRGRGLKADRLVQLADWGVFQIDKIVAARSQNRPEARTGSTTSNMELDEDLLDQPSQDQDDLAELATNDLIMADVDHSEFSQPDSVRKGVLLDDHHYFSDEDVHVQPKPKRLPKGTSAYQAAWLLDDDTDASSDSGEELDQDGDLSMDQVESGEALSGINDTGSQMSRNETAPSEAAASEMFLDPSPDDEMEDLAAFRSRQKRDMQDDLEFPDEIELPPTVLARDRLARYRGLKSTKTSAWEKSEDQGHEPEDWNRLLQMTNYKASKSRTMREALVGGAPPGTRVHVHIRNVPASFRTWNPMQNPLCLYSLLRHENKRTVVNISITLDATLSSPIKSKDELIVQCGPRRLIINPLFSQPGQTPNNVHKYNRYLHPGRTAVATFTGPMIWGSVPALFFRRSAAADAATDTDADNLELIGTGTTLAPDLERVIAKRVILSGHPYKIHKNVVTVRYMFFNAADVKWFKALKLWTRRGRTGFIKESLGTHGYFKATFDGRINPQDAVCITLHKRVFPRPATPWKSVHEV